MAALLSILAMALGAHQPAPYAGFLAFAETPRRPGNVVSRYTVAGRSAEGRPIELWQYGDPSWSGELLVFGASTATSAGRAE